MKLAGRSWRTGDTIAAALTPSGRGAVASIGIRGPDALSCIAKFFHSGAPGRDGGPYDAWDRIQYGQWRHTDGMHEELVVVRLAHDRLEVHCHGGEAAIASILHALHACGAHVLSWEQWSEATDEDPLVTETRIALAHARTSRAAATLIRQSRGLLRAAFVEILGLLAAGHVPSAQEKLELLAQRGVWGRHLITPWRVVFTGPPNVGKSSLVNALLGYSRSLVDPSPGTTRDVVITSAMIEQWLFEFADTAGIREADDDVEREGVERARASISSADVVVRVHDARTFHPLGLHVDMQVRSTRRLEVVNKVDLVAPHNRIPTWLYTSTRTGEGIETLAKSIWQSCVPAELRECDAVPFTEKQIAAIEKALAAIEAGLLATAGDAIANLLSPT